MIPSSTPLSTLIGLIASILAALLGLGYLTTILTSFIKDGMAMPPSESVQLAGAINSIGIGVVLVVVMAALKWHLPPERQILAEIAIIFAALLCVSTSINRYVQLSTVPQYHPPENASTLGLIHPYGDKSIMFAIESLGWGLFYGLAVLFAGLALVGGTGLDRWISWLFIVGGILSLLYALGFIIKHPILSLLGFPAWSLLATAAVILLAVRFVSFL